MYTTIRQALLPPFRSPALVLSASVIAAALLQQTSSVAHITALVLVLALIAATMAEPWLGILALFPLVIPIAAPSEAPGIKEAAFAILTTTVLGRSLMGAIARDGITPLAKEFGFPLLIGLALLAVNLFAAVNVGTNLHDWVRGVVPYTFLVMTIPITLELRDDIRRVHWIGIAIGVAITLHCVHVLGYYLLNRMWEYQWYVNIDGVLTRVTEEAAKADPEHVLGPFIDRITMKLPSSTDAFIPLGVSLGFIIAVIAPGRRERWFGMVLVTLALPTILVTYTRSMLLSPLLVICGFCIYLAFFRRAQLKFAALLLAGFSLYAVAVIFFFGLELVWLKRVLMLLDAAKQSIASFGAYFNIGGGASSGTDKQLSGQLMALSSSPGAIDDNVTTRIEEYRIAWSMFLEHPIFGNGLGTRHEISFVRSAGDIIRQSVGYIHNWPLYMLMAGGVLGFVFYAVLLLGPVFLRAGTDCKATFEKVLLHSMPATLAIYGLFFAVARLITFNLLIAATWGILLALGVSIPALANRGKGRSTHPFERGASSVRSD
ncbi:O-antigen ligase family protein [Noviherbaspirillum autotrophicum]|uniref:O-antigen ligase family protein n=1 Tax=Noviherbaspirillum autotrophicum TaxID=709839 RepID=UPI0009FCC46B|nr:O-antigen ligase family protein [Noviherbaspirillum autotrophicum]